MGFALDAVRLLDFSGIRWADTCWLERCWINDRVDENQWTGKICKILVHAVWINHA